MELQLQELDEKKKGLVLKSSTKSEEQILLEDSLEREENFKRILNEREDIIAVNEKNINDLRNKLQVNGRRSMCKNCL